MSKACIYARVSTQEQQKSETIQTQLTKLRKNYEGQNIVKEYIDNGWSGSYMSRPALNELRADAKRGMFDIIGLYSLDRLSRKVGHQLALVDEFKKEGVEIEVLGKKFEDTPQGEFSLIVLSAVAQLERAVITQRMLDAKYRKANEGKLIGCYPAYGYKLIKKTERDEAQFEINLKEAKTVKRMFKIYLEEQSIRQTIKRLTKMGARGRGRRGEEGKNPSPFCPRAIGRMLRNESYIGNFYYGKTYPCEVENPKEGRRWNWIGRKSRPKAEWKLIKIPSIIDKPIFDRVQKILNYRKKYYLQPTKYNYLCQGLIKCIHCNRTYYGKPAGKVYISKNGPKRYFSYFCPNKFQPEIGKKRCLSKSMSVPKLDKYVWGYISALINQPEKVKKAIRLLKKKRDSETSFNQKVYDSLIIEKTELEKKKSRILDLYIDKSLLKEDLDKKIEELNGQERILDKQIKEAEKDVQKIEEINTIEKEVEQLCLGYRNMIKKADFKLKKKIVRKWVKEINITDEGDIIIKVRIPEIEAPRVFRSQFIPQALGQPSPLLLH